MYFQDLVDFGYKAWTNGWLEPLDPYIHNSSLTEAATLDIGDFFPKFLDGFRLPDSKSGKLYGIPITVETYVIFYRKDLFQQYKINVSSLKTVDDWLAAVQHLAPQRRDLPLDLRLRGDEALFRVRRALGGRGP